MKANLRFSSFILITSSLALSFAWKGPAATHKVHPKRISSVSSISEAPNCSFLNDTRHNSMVNPLKDVVMDDHTALELKQRYQDLNREYELKRTYGLLDMQAEQRHGDDIHGFGREIFGEVRRYQTNKQAENLKANVEKDPGLKAFAKPAAVVAGGAAIGTGTPLKLRIDENTKFQSITNLTRQTGQFSLTSDVVNTSLDLDLSHQDPNATILDPTQKTERYRLNMSRGLPLWNLSGGVSYGMSTSLMTASLSKSLSDNLTAVVDASRPTQPGTDPEESLKVFYGLRF